MAILFYANHTHKTFRNVQDTIDKFMVSTWAEGAGIGWLDIQDTQLESCEAPWHHPRLVTLAGSNDEPDLEHYDTKSWSYVVQAMYKTFTNCERCMHTVHNAAPNKWFPKVKGDVLSHTPRRGQGV